MYSTNYSFETDYSTLSTVQMPFEIKNRFGQMVYDARLDFNVISERPSPSAMYTGQFGGFYATPIFDSRGDGVSARPDISDVNYLFDFGDGTVIRNTISAYHEYKLPGVYNLTLIGYTSAGQAVRSGQSTRVNVKDVISDKIILSKSSDSQNVSEGTNIFYITRFNNVPSSNILSADNYPIKISLEGNQSQQITQNNYINDKNFQYTVSSFIFNDVGDSFQIIDRVTTSNDFIYAEYVDSNLLFTQSPSETNFLVGTSGTGKFRVYEPTTKVSTPINVLNNHF